MARLKILHRILVTIALFDSLRLGKKGSIRSFQVIAAKAEIPDDKVLKTVNIYDKYVDL